METLSAFVNDISSFKINLPLWLKLGVIIILIIGLVIGGYFMQDIFNSEYFKRGFNWFIVIAVINLLSIALIFYYYGKKNNKYVGGSGKRGKKGIRGKKGSSVSCAYNCKNNIYIQTVRKTDIICTLSVYNKNFNSLITIYNYFDNFINNSKSNNIDYESFIQNILIKNTVDANSSTDKFRSLLSTNSITIFLIKHINKKITTASTRTYGTFRSTVPKVGYIALGDSVYGGSEQDIIKSSSPQSSNFNLNSFVVNGNIMYPAGYTKLVSFNSYNEETEDYEMYTIWQPVIQSINDTTFEGGAEQHSFMSLGDVCSFGSKQPAVNNFALIKDECLEPVNIKDLKLIFIYIGDFELNEIPNKEKTTIDYTQSDSYLIENTIIKDVEIFSVWRTPMNTFITNCNTNNELINNTLIYNILNGVDDALNEYGNINNEYKKWVQDNLQNIEMPKFLTAMIYTKHLMIESRKDLIYYINKYQGQVQEFKNIALTLNNFEIYDLLNIIKNIIADYDKFNKDLVKRASISAKGDKLLVYNKNDEKHLPQMIINIYNNIINKINTLAVQIENANTLFDIVNYIIPNGIYGRIAVDSNGIIEGGIFLNEIQDIIVRLCKIILPPSRRTYIIKDECLGTFARDTTREQVIREFINVKDKYNKYIDEIKNNSTQYQSQMNMIKIYEELSLKKLGQLCGHIAGYMDKIHNAELDEITTNRIQGIIRIYIDINSHFATIVV